MFFGHVGSKDGQVAHHYDDPQDPVRHPSQFQQHIPSTPRCLVNLLTQKPGSHHARLGCPGAGDIAEILDTIDTWRSLGG